MEPQFESRLGKRVARESRCCDPQGNSFNQNLTLIALLPLYGTSLNGVPQIEPHGPMNDFHKKASVANLLQSYGLQAMHAAPALNKMKYVGLRTDIVL